MSDDAKDDVEEQQMADAPAKDSPSSEPPEDIDVHGEYEATRLRALAADVRDQDDLERD
ncbi:MAG: hypothetical protein Q9169_008621, partial [Polycauliona sp. 2 TL-2023]